MDKLPDGFIYGVVLRFMETECDHGAGIGSDMFEDGKDNVAILYGKKLGCITLEAYGIIAKMLPQYYLNKNANINYDAYEQICTNIEAHYRKMPHYQLFMAAGFQTIYSHLSAYFGVFDFFSAHRDVIRNGLIKMDPAQFYHQKMAYDTICAIMYEHNGYESFGYYGSNNAIDAVCRDFEHSILKIIRPMALVVSSFYLLGYYGKLSMNNSTYYLIENLKKTGCGNAQHNTTYSEGYGLNYDHDWLSKYHLLGGYYHPEPLLECLKRPLQLLINCFEPRMAMQNIQIGYEQDILYTPDGSLVVTNTKHVCYVDPTLVQGLSFNKNSKFVFISKRAPDIFYLEEELRSYFTSIYAILWDGRDAAIVALGDEHTINPKKNRIIIKNKHYVIWVHSLVPNIRLNNQQRKHKLLVPIGGIGFTVPLGFMAHLKNVMAGIGFGEMERMSIEWLIEHLTSSGVGGALF